MKRGEISEETGRRLLMFAISESMIRAGGKLPAKQYSLGFGLKCATTTLTVLIVALILLAATLGALGPT